MGELVQDQASKKQMRRVWMVIMLGSLTAFGPLSMDMYLPALPNLAVDLKTTASLTQVSLTACLIGLAAGQLVFGPLSDIHGRRKPLVFTLISYAIVSLLAAFSPNIWVFILLRFFQGFTGAAGIVIARASASDMYSGTELTKFMALLSLVLGAAPILAPISGGFILSFAPWSTIFLLLGFIGIIMFIAVIFFLPETLPVEKRTEGNMLAVIGTFGSLLKDRVFLGIAGTQAFIMTSMFAYIAGSPFVLQNIYEVTPQQFSLLFALNGLGIIIGAQLTGRLSSTISEAKLLFGGVSLAFVGSIWLIIVIVLELPLWAITVALFLIISSVGVVSTSSFSLAMGRQGKTAGSASAFLGLLPFIGGAIVSPLVGIAGEEAAWPMGVVMAFCTSAALLLFIVFVRGSYFGHSKAN